MIAVKKGDRVSEYVLEEPLGRGGFGEVWRARHHMWADREVAVKIPTSPEAVKSLANEGLIQSALAHPGIATPLAMDTEGDPPYFITEYVEGENLRTIMAKEGPMEPARVHDILSRILDVLEYAHSENVIHQDIKPENIMITPSGDVKLTDFGLGQTMTGESILLSASLRSESPAVAGTFPYIAPEIRDGADAIDARADLYSLGIVVFELLTGKRPVGGEVPSDLVQGLPGWCDEIFRGLHTRRSSRFENVQAVRASLFRAKETVITAPGEKPAGPPKSPTSAKSGPKVIPLVPPKEQLLSEAEACAALGLSDREFRHWTTRGYFKPYSIDGKTYVTPEEVETFRKQHPTVSFTGHSASAGAGVQERPSGPRPVLVPKQPPVSGAGFLPRAVAMLIDLCILSLLLSPMSPLAAGRMSASFLGISFGFPLFISMLYFALATGHYGKTIGKAALGLKVVRTDGKPLGVFDGGVRFINYLASLLPFGLGFFVIPFSSRRLAFHDVLCGTQVVYDNGEETPQDPAV